LFYGIPDWVYEEEVFANRVATWWSGDGKYLAFLRTNESEVPTYPVEFFLSRPSHTLPETGQENYPEVTQIKYPKAGAPNPYVDIAFYDVESKSLFAATIEDDFPPEDRLITEVMWAGSTHQVLVRETNRESDILRVMLIDVKKKAGRMVRTQDVNALDGGWLEISQTTKFIPADEKAGRPQDGYIDTVIVDGFNHLAYFTPMDSSEPRLLTKGSWEVVDAPSSVDLANNLVYFVSTREGSTQRHVYYTNLLTGDVTALTDTSQEGYYDVSFSHGSQYALLSYTGPGVPWQMVLGTPSLGTSFQRPIEENQGLSELAKKYELPLLNYGTINIDGNDLNFVERRPPHFNPKNKYPVVFYMYQGPGSQTVSKQFRVDFQSYLASNLGYIVVTVDGRGTGFLGRKIRCVVRGKLGHYEVHDQIAAAKEWAAKPYVDADKMAIWGWSFGGFTTLKTLEVDGGETFKYGMAVAPVTDWRFYDSVYTERYMRTPQHNLEGYANATVSNATRLGQNTRFLIMHGVADDNVHMQSTLVLVDRLNTANVVNYDMHLFPDSNHGIYFRNANRIVYEKLSKFLINAFNGEFLRMKDAEPVSLLDSPVMRERRDLVDVAKRSGVLP